MLLVLPLRCSTILVMMTVLGVPLRRSFVKKVNADAISSTVIKDRARSTLSGINIQHGFVAVETFRSHQLDLRLLKHVILCACKKISSVKRLESSAGSLKTKKELPDVLRPSATVIGRKSLKRIAAKARWVHRNTESVKTFLLVSAMPLRHVSVATAIHLLILKFDVYLVCTKSVQSCVLFDVT